MEQATLRERREQRRENPGPLRRAQESGRIYWARPWIGSLWLAAFAWATRGVSLLVRDSPDGEPLTAPYWPIAVLVFGAALVGVLIAWKRLDDSYERWAVAVTATVAAGWVAAVWWALAPWDWLMYALAGITLAGAGVYYTNHRAIERDDVAAEMRAWPALVKGSEWEDTQLVSPREVFSWGYRLRVRRPSNAKVTNKDLTGARGRDSIESRLGAPDGSADVEQVGRSKTDLTVTVVTNDPHESGVRWDGKVARSITDKVLIGKYNDGSLEETSWWTPGEGGYHRLIAGITRSGKSTLMKLLALIYGPAEDTILTFIDLKGGMSFRRLFPMGHWNAKKADEALAILRSLNQVIEERAVLAGDWGMDPWEPDRTRPVHLVFIDELAKLIGINAPRHVASEALPLLINIVQQGAGVGVLLCMATQFPTLEALGSSQLREQIEWAACFRLRDSGTAHFVLPNANSAVEPASIPKARRGTCYVDAGGELRESTLRCCDVTSDQLDTVVNAWWDRTPEVPDYDLAVYAPDYDHRTIYLPDGTSYVLDPDHPDATLPSAPEDAADLYDTDDDPDIEDDTLTEEQDMTVSLTSLLAAERAEADPAELAQRDAQAATMRVSEESTPENEATALAWQAMLQAGDAGLAPKDLRLAADRGESWSFTYVNALVTLGFAEKLGFGRYRRLPDRKYDTPDFTRVRSLQQGKG